MLMEINKSRFDPFRATVVRNCIDHIPYYLSGLSRERPLLAGKVIGKLFKLHDGNQQIFDDPFQVSADIYEKGSCSRTYFQRPTVELQHWISQSVNKTKIY